MKTSKYYKQMMALTVAVAICSLFWIYWTLGRTLNTLVWGGVALREGYETVQIAIAISYSVFPLLLIITQMTFLIKQLKSIKNGIIFAKSNSKYLVIWSILWLFYDFCASQVGNMIAAGIFNQITIHGTIIGIPIVVLLFAILYKLAADVAEENNLTI